MAQWRSSFPQFAQRMQEAGAAGLIAAARVLQRHVKRGLRGGYTTGDWVTGYVMNSVTISAVASEGGALVIRVGTNVPYALYWELGWTPRVVMQIAGLAGGTVAAPLYRKEVWRPALVASREECAAAFARVFARTLKRETGSQFADAMSLSGSGLESDRTQGESADTSTANRTAQNRPRRKKAKRRRKRRGKGGTET